MEARGAVSCENARRSSQHPPDRMRADHFAPTPNLKIALIALRLRRRQCIVDWAPSRQAGVSTGVGFPSGVGRHEVGDSLASVAAIFARLRYSDPCRGAMGFRRSAPRNGRFGFLVVASQFMDVE